MAGPFMATEVRPARGREIRLRPLHPNAGLTAAYLKRLAALVDQMDRSVRYWIEARYKNNEPLMALDEAPRRPAGLSGKGVEPRYAGGREKRWNVYVNGKPVLKGDGTPRSWKTRDAAERAGQALLKDTPAQILTDTFEQLRDRWTTQFDEAAPKLADYFGKAVNRRTDEALQAILRKGGFSVKFQMSPAMRDVLDATISQNVALIKSIPAKYLGDVEGAVMRSVQTGRDLGTLSAYLEDTYGVTKRRAAFIARSQNNLATAAMNRARQDEIGIEQGRWRHSGGGKHKRPTHVKNSGKLYDVKKGWWDPAVKRYIWPGTEPGCRCVSISVIPGWDS